MGDYEIAIAVDNSRWRERCYGRMEELIRRWPSFPDKHIPFSAIKNEVMVYELYKAVRDENQDVDGFVHVLEEVCEEKQFALSNIFDQVTSTGDSLLHVAAEFGKKEIAELITHFFPKLLYKRNITDDTPLHTAARAKSNEVMEVILFKFENIDVNHFIVSENTYGNTPLHEAVLSKNLDGVTLLLNAHNESALAHYWTNIFPNKSPIYLAVLTADVRILRRLVQIPFPLNHLISKCRGNSPLHAAILERNPDLFQKMVDIREELMYLRDENDDTPLHFAASIGYLEGVCILLNKSTSTAFQKNSAGNLPIHLACKRGRIRVVKKLLRVKRPRPHVRLWLNNKSQIILHIAAMSGDIYVVKYLLRNPKIHRHEIVNERDVNGNTPLHLAAKEFRLWTLLLLSRDKKIDLNLMNNKDLTARDIIWMSCKIIMRRQEFMGDLILASAGLRAMPNIFDVRPIVTNNTERDAKKAANTLMLVGILIATVTFAAGFTIPGGVYSSDDPDPKERGMQFYLIKHYSRYS